MSTSSSSTTLEAKPPPKYAGTTQRALVWAAVLIPVLAPLLVAPMLWQRWVDGTDLALFGAFYLLSTLGITVGYHRMLTHRAFVPHPIVKAVLLGLGSMSLMGPARTWAVTHLQHHAHADDDGDPHSPWDWVHRLDRVRRTGWRQFWRAHFVWIVCGDEVVARHAPWLMEDRAVSFVSRPAVCWGLVALGFLIAFAIGGWSGLVWGGIIRIGFTHHVTWSINSVCHLQGARAFSTHDCSRNNLLFGLLAMGEGWHNNHHAWPRSAFHGLRWWQVDVSGYVIRALEAVGLAKAVWRIPPQRLADRAAAGPDEA